MTVLVGPDPARHLPSEATRLRFDATVPRKLVHRAAISETFLTDALELGADRYLVAAQLPRAHALYSDVPGNHQDLLLLAEAVRQAGTLLAHRFYDVPEGTIFPLRTAQIEVSDLDALTLTDRAAELVADVQIFGQEHHGGALSAMSLRADYYLDGRPAGSAAGAMHLVSPSGYGALRAQHRPVEMAAPATADRPEPAGVGRADRRNVVVGDFLPRGDAAFSARVLADTGHPAYFDHPQDHIPGMLLLEAYRQLSLLSVAEQCGWAAEGLLTVECDAAFSRYAELHLETLCVATVGEPVLPHRGAAWVPVSLELTQAGVTLSRARVRVAAVGSHLS
jgi:hypothetical protein